MQALSSSHERFSTQGLFEFQTNCTEIEKFLGRKLKVLCPTLTSGRIIDHFSANFHNDFFIHSDTILVDSSLTDHNIVVTTIKFVSCSNSHFVEIITDQILSSNNSDEVTNKAILFAIKGSIKVSTFSVKHNERINKYTSSDALKLIKEKDKWFIEQV